MFNACREQYSIFFSRLREITYISISENRAPFQSRRFVRTTVQIRHNVRPNHIGTTLSIDKFLQCSAEYFNLCAIFIVGTSISEPLM